MLLHFKALAKKGHSEIHKRRITGRYKNFEQVAAEQ